MNSGRARQLWAKALSGERLDPREDAELAEILREDLELRREFLADAKTHGLLSWMLRGAGDAEADVRQFRMRLAAEREASGFIRRVEARLSASRSRTRRFRRPADLAAALPSLVAVALLVALFALAGLRSRETPRKERPAPVVRYEAPAEPDAAARPAAPAPAPVVVEPEPEPPGLAEPETISVPAAPEPVPPVMAPEPAPETAPPAPRETRVAAVSLLDVRGAWAVGPQGRRRLAPRDVLVESEELHVDPDGEAVLAYFDGTRVRALGGTLIAEPRAEPAKRLRLLRGVVKADVAKQPRGREMVLSTPYADAVVLGTRFRLSVFPEGARLEVLEGRVRFRGRGGKDVDVPGGGHATASSEGAVSSARVTTVDEILLLPRDGKIVGRDWRLSPDGSVEATERRRASESEERLRARLLGFVEWSFAAEPQKEYHVWIRGSALGGKDERHDGVAIEAPGARFSAPCAYFGARQPNHYFVSGYAHANGAAWLGGMSDPYSKTVGPLTVTGRGDEVPARLRYARPGTQTLRLYPIETPVRIEAIWLTATRKTRPDASMRGP